MVFPGQFTDIIRFLYSDDSWSIFGQICKTTFLNVPFELLIEDCFDFLTSHLTSFWFFQVIMKPALKRLVEMTEKDDRILKLPCFILFYRTFQILVHSSCPDRRRVPRLPLRPQPPLQGRVPPPDLRGH